jgi:hypothetical protein
MWLAYTERMLQFAQEPPDTCLVVPHVAVLNGLPLHDLLNDRWGVSLHPPSTPVVKPHQLADAVDDRLLRLVSPALKARMDAVWAQLSALTTGDVNLWLGGDWAQPPLAYSVR